MPHKTLYVDIDEEITSIADRVKKAQASEVIIVVPKRALLLQSIVNLKLLKKEADRKKKQIMIVTQDKVGRKLIEKAGILVQGKVDDPSIIEASEVEEDSPTYARETEVAEEFEGGKEKRKLGSDSFFNGNLDFEKEKVFREMNIKEELDHLRKVSKVSGKDKQVVEKDDENEFMKDAESMDERKSGDRQTGKVKMSDIVSGSKPKKTRRQKKVYSKKKEVKKQKEAKENLVTNSFYDGAAFDKGVDKKADKFFKGASFKVSLTSSRREKRKLEKIKVKGGAVKYFFVFVVIFIVLGCSAGVYFYLPKAEVAIHLKSQQRSVALNVQASVKEEIMSQDGNNIPAALEQIVKEETEEFEATGKKSGGGKASGSVVIYNEYSSASQPLVKTTRLETKDGKIFRITKSVVVPGMARVEGKSEPGAVEVEVIADKPGEEYNIKPAEFTIPGFKGNPKYNKFYAKSTKAMKGGASGDISIVTSRDIIEAKEKLIKKAEKNAVKALVDSIPDDRKIFEDAVVTKVESAVSSVKVGAESEKFAYTVKVKAKALSFFESDVKDLVKKDLEKRGINVDLISLANPVNYILVDSDNDRGFLKFDAKAEVEISSDVDLENFKKGILGKKADEVEDYAKSYSSIQKADVNFWPFFINKVPFLESRVKVEVK